MAMQRKELRNNLISLSKKTLVFERIARLVMEQEQRILFMTAEQAAKEAGVSQGSVTRFCHELGYAGYSDFIKQLQVCSADSANATAPERLRFTENIDESTIRIISSERENLDKIYHELQRPEYKEMVEAIANADRILLISARLSATLFEYMHYILNKVRDGVEIVYEGSVRWNNLALNDPKATLVLTIAFPRYPNVLIRKLKELDECGFQIMAITDSLLSPVREYAKNSVIVPLTQTSIFDVYSTPMLLMNILLKDVSARIPDLEDRMNRMEEMDKRNSAYYSKEER